MLIFKLLSFLTFLLFSQLSIVSAAQPTFLKEVELNSLGLTRYEDVNPNLLIYPLKG